MWEGGGLERCAGFWSLKRYEVQCKEGQVCKRVSDRVAPDGETLGTPYARGAVADPPAHLLGGAMGVLNAHNGFFSFKPSPKEKTPGPRIPRSRAALSYKL